MNNVLLLNVIAQIQFIQLKQLRMFNLTEAKDSRAGHIKEIDKKANESVMKFKKHMTGSMYSEFDKVVEKKTKQPIKEIDEI